MNDTTADRMNETEIEEREREWRELDAMIDEASKGNRKKMDALIARYSGWIRMYARRWMSSRPQVMSEDDAYAVAMEGFWNSTMKFDRSRGRNFLGFTEYGMNESLKNAWSSEFSSRGISRSRRRLWGRIKDAEEIILDRGGVPTDALIASMIPGTTVQKIAETREKWHYAFPESMELLTENLGDTWQKGVSDPLRLDPRKDSWTLYEDAFGRLSPEEQSFVRMIDEGRSRTEIAEFFDMTERSVTNWKNRIRQQLETEMEAAA